MFSKFLDLDAEKQNRILNAAMREFAHKGFVNASTNEIVKEAKIGKGMLFHYFNNKKDLFLFLYDHILEIAMNEYYDKIDMSERDILKRIRQALAVKFTLVNKYPEMFEFIKTVNFEDADEVKKELESRNSSYMAGGLNKIFSDIDTSKFKENIDIKRAVNSIIWTVDALAAKERVKARSLSLDKLNYDELLAELDLYLELFRNSFYKA